MATYRKFGIYRRGDSKYYWYSFRIHGVRVNGSTKTPDLKLAVAICQKRRTEFLEGKHFGKFKTKLPEMVQIYLINYSKVNKRSYLNDVTISKKILGFFGETALTDISPQFIERYKAERLRNVSPARVNRELSFLRAMFNKAIEWGKANENPLKKVKFFKEERRVERYLSPEERKRFFEVCPDFLKPIILTALKTGMRQGEILNLNWDDVDINTSTIHVRKTKSGQVREIPLNHELEKVLRQLPHQSEYVFSNSAGDSYSRHGKLRWEFEKALRLAGIRHFRFHDLRHTFASELVMKGLDLRTIQDYLGHSSFRMTERYAHLLPNHKRLGIELLSKENCYDFATVSNDSENMEVAFNKSS